MSRRRSLSHRQRVTDTVPQTGGGNAEFTNVTALSWPGVLVPLRFAADADHRRLRAAMMESLTRLSYAELAALSWPVDSLLSAKEASESAPLDEGSDAG